MSRRGIMFAVASLADVDPAAMEKAVQVSLALDADLELLHCVFDAHVAHPGRCAMRGQICHRPDEGCELGVVHDARVPPNANQALTKYFVTKISRLLHLCVVNIERREAGQFAAPVYGVLPHRLPSASRSILQRAAADGVGR